MGDRGSRPGAGGGATQEACGVGGAVQGDRRRGRRNCSGVGRPPGRLGGAARGVVGAAQGDRRSRPPLGRHKLVAVQRLPALSAAGRTLSMVACEAAEQESQANQEMQICVADSVQLALPHLNPIPMSARTVDIFNHVWDDLGPHPRARLAPSKSASSQKWRRWLFGPERRFRSKTPQHHRSGLRPPDPRTDTPRAAPTDRAPTPAMNQCTTCLPRGRRGRRPTVRPTNRPTARPCARLPARPSVRPPGRPTAPEHSWHDLFRYGKGRSWYRFHREPVNLA